MQIALIMKNFTVILTISLLPLISHSLRAEPVANQVASAPVGQFDHSHAAFTFILSQHVKNELVDYAGLKRNPAPLNSYLDALATVAEPAFKKWDRKQQMAYLINLYNAATLKLVVDHHPLKSIKEIGGAKGPWKQEVVRLFGKLRTLDHVEHDLLRPGYQDARVHFGVNCASIGCPALRAEAFQATKLDAQLDEQGRIFVRDASKNRLDAKNKTLNLSEIFDWFKGDFAKDAGTVEKFIAKYASDADRQVIQKGGLSIKHTKYDWSLNQP